MTENEKSEGLGDVIGLVVEYVKQETVDPMRGLGRYLGFGLSAAFFIGIGCLLLLLSGLRALQTQTGTAFNGNWNWAPYAITLGVAALIMGMAASAIGRTKRKFARRKARR